MEQATAEYLDVLRECDEISSVNYAVEIVRLWAESYDQVHPADGDHTSAQIVGSLLEDEVKKRAAFDAGYHGRNYFPVYLGAVTKPVEQIFGHSIHRG